MKKSFQFLAVTFFLIGYTNAVELAVNQVHQATFAENNSALVIDFDTEAGFFYQLEYSKDANDFRSQGQKIVGFGGSASVVASGQGEDTAFFRITRNEIPEGESTPELLNRLSQLETQIASIQNAQSEPEAFQTLFYDVEGNQSQALQILSGRIFLHSVISNRTTYYLFDGAGSASNSGQFSVTSGQAITFCWGTGDTDTTCQVMDVIFENGVYMSKFELPGTTTDNVIFFYKRLD